MKNGLLAAALQRSRKKDSGTISDDLRMTHEAIVEVMKEEGHING